MKENYTHITVILDRSGSMESIRDDIVGGFNAFLRGQQGTAGADAGAEGVATLTLVQFDSEDPYEVIHAFKLVQAVPSLSARTYVPRGATPLLDALGRGINDLDATLTRMAETNRPAHIIFVVITDGMENASREFTREQVARMIAEKQGVAGWQFVFLSADLSAVAEAENMGIRPAQSLAFDKTARGSHNAFSAVSANVLRVRQGEMPHAEFTNEERDVQESERRRGKK